MEKLNELVKFLKEMSGYDVSLKKDCQALIRLLGKFHDDSRASLKFFEKVDVLVAKAQLSQAAGKFPKNFFVRFFGSVLEFERECATLADLISK